MISEIITVERRRRWSLADKRRIVAETLAPGVSVSAVARRYGLHGSQVFAWRRLARLGTLEEAGDGGLGGPLFTSVAITAAGLQSSCGADLHAAPESATDGVGRIEIILLSGDRVLVGATVDGAASGRALAVLRPR